MFSIYNLGVLLFLAAVVRSVPIFEANEGNMQPNKPAGPGLWNSIGEHLKTHGEAMPTQVHLPHETNPRLILKDSVNKMVKGNYAYIDFC